MKKILSRLLCVALLLLGAVLIYKIADLLITNDSESQTRIDFHDFYAQERVDILFVGTSHAVYGVNAPQINEGVEGNVYSLATSGQDFPGTYYLLQDAFRQQPDIKQVFFEFSASRLRKQEAKDTLTYIISDYMRSPLVKLRFLTDTQEAKKYVNAFFRARRNIDPMELPTLEEMGENYTIRRSDEYRSFTPAGNYLGLGSWRVKRALSTDNTLAMNYADDYLDDITTDDITQYSLDYFEKIIDLCHENGVELTMFVSPYPECYLMRFPQYEQVTAVAAGIAQEKGVPFIDLNLVKDEYLKLEAPNFWNLDHMNITGSEKVADFLIRYIHEPDGDYLCGSLEEKYPHTDDVRFAGFDVTYLDKSGSKSSASPCKGGFMQIDLSAGGYVEIPAAAEVYNVSKDPDSGKWIPGDAVAGQTLDNLRTRFVLPYDENATSYLVRLLAPDTGELLYETVTSFASS